VSIRHDARDRCGGVPWPNEEPLCPAAIVEIPAPLERSVFANASGSRRGIAANVPGLPAVSVVFPAPFAPAMMVRVGRLSDQKRAHRRQRARRLFVPEALQVGGGLLQPLLSRLQLAFASSPTNRRACHYFTTSAFRDTGELVTRRDEYGWLKGISPSAQWYRPLFVFVGLRKARFRR
jgi:hypothetical protein